MGIEHIKPIPILNNLYFSLWLLDARSKINRIKNSIGDHDKILDVGCGPGSVSLLLKEQGYDVISLDIKDISFTNKVKPVLYDGHFIPFGDKEF